MPGILSLHGLQEGARERERGSDRKCQPLPAVMIQMKQGATLPSEIVLK